MDAFELLPWSTAVVFGRRTPWPATLKREELDGSNGFLVNGPPGLTNGGSVAVSFVSDINGDGGAELAFSTTPQGGPASGFGVLFGRTTFPSVVEAGEFDGSDGFLSAGLEDTSNSPRIGAALAGTGDMNGDGLGDWIVGIPNLSDGTQIGRGQAAIVFGRSQFEPELDLAQIDGCNGTFITSGGNDGLGYSVSGVGDVNADGVPDAVIGTQTAEFLDGAGDQSRAFIVFGVSQDFDEDGVIDSVDNCTRVFNPDQFDGDGDGIGNRCDGDFNNDSITNVLDLGILRTVFFTDDPRADLDGNGVVNVVDLGLFRELFFRPPGPACP